MYVTGGTGYIGQRVIADLLRRGHAVRALARPGSESRIPAGAEVVTGDALAAGSFAATVAPFDTFVHLVGTPHPNPAKAAEFLRVDLASIGAAIAAASSAGIRHFIYVSVAHPAPIMRAYIDVRRAGENMIRHSGVPSTVLRPWYVLGPGHRWPYALVPVYWVLSKIPATAAGAGRLGLVTREQMVGAIVRAVENPPAAGMRIVEVPDIRHS